MREEGGDVVRSLSGVRGAQGGVFIGPASGLRSRSELGWVRGL